MKKGEYFESFVAYVYSNLLKFSDCNSIVSRNISIKGLSGSTHEFDVYYDFYHLDMLFRVAIECKDWERPVDKGRVQEFWAKIDDLNNIAGVMIAKSGYQAGALQFAESKGIMLLTIQDLPSFTQILARNIEWLLLPDEKAVGQPFWTLMEKDNNHLTGNYFSLNPDPESQVPLFYTKNLAKLFLNYLPDKEHWCVRGISQAQLKALVEISMNLSHQQFALCPLPTIRDLQVEFILLDAKEIQQNYCFT